MSDSADFWVVDVGNTFIKFGRANDGGVERVRGLNFQEHLDSALSALEQALAEMPGHIVACSVGPAKINSVLAALAAKSGSELRWVSVTREVLGVTCGYEDTNRLGVDRWVGVLAAYRDEDDAVVVADIGTATTIDAVLPGGKHIGGMILPGLLLMERALDKALAHLQVGSEQLVDPKTPRDFFAKDTALAIQNGCLLALGGAIREAHGTLIGEDQATRLVITGGGAPAVVRYLPAAEHRPALILEGLARLQCAGGW